MDNDQTYYRHYWERIGGKTYSNWQGGFVDLSMESPEDFLSELKKEREEYCKQNPDGEEFEFRMVMTHEISELDYEQRALLSIPINQYIWRL